MFKNMKIGTKILIAFTTVAIVAVGLVGFFAFTSGSSTLEEESFNKLTAVREMKASQIEDYFQLVENQVITLSQDRMIIDAMRDFDDGLHGMQKELDISADELESMDIANYGYYENQFLPRLIPNLLQDVSVEDFWPEDEKSRILQYFYISSNPHQTGEKHQLNKADDGSSYSEAHSIYHPIIRDYLDKFGYYDIFLVDVGTEGHIAYSVFKEVDFGTSLLTGPYEDTNFAEAYNAARAASDKDFVNVVDFEPYVPSYNAPAAFIASPIFDGDEKIGVLVFQFPIDQINAVMTSNQDWSAVGLGESGETYIVGNDFLLRNQSRFLIEDSENYFRLIEEIGTPLTTIARIRNLNSTIGLQEVRTDGTKAALSGLTGTDIFPDYRGVPVLSSYKPLNIRDANWVIMSEIDQEEAFAAIRSLGIRTFVGVMILIVAIIVFAIAFSRTITKPLDRLTQTADDLAKGNLDVEVAYKEQGDEIGILASSFDMMRVSMKGLIGDLEDVNQNLENLVEERTKELELSELRSRSIIESAGEGIVVIDHDSNIILWNRSAEKLFGYTADEMIGISISRLIPQRYDSQHEDASMRALDTGQLAKPVVTHELAGKRKDGSEFPLELTLAVWSIAGETFISGIIRDISERKAAEERIRTIVELAPDAVITIDAQQTITLFNPTAERVFGYSADEVLGQSLTMLMPEKSRGIHGLEVEKFGKETSIGRDMDARRDIIGQRNDGTLFPAEAGISKMVINGKDYFTTFFRDITERRQAEETIRENEARFRSLFEDSPISLWEEDLSAVKVFIDELFDSGVIDLRVHFESHPSDLNKCASLIKVLDVNQATLDLYQAESKDQLLGSLDRIFTEESSDSLIDELVTLAGGSTWYEGEIVNRKLDGTFFDCIIGFSVAPGSEGTWSKVFVSIMDITERKMLEEKLEENALSAQLMYRSSELATSAETEEDALQMVLDEICKLTGWPVGHVYVLNKNGSQTLELQPTDIWSLDDLEEFTEFVRVTEITTFEKGIGLPGRVLESGNVAWISNVQEDSNFPRRELTPNLVVKGAFGVPVKVFGNVEAVLEFFSDQVVEPDENLINIMTLVADQLSRVFERRQMEEVMRQQKERMEIELNFAREIQLNMLPLIFPAFPNRTEVAVHAALESAREVGGDFYDFYFLDDDHLCFVIGDVAGKGAPGALMMAVSKTLIKSRAADDNEPASILTHVNDELSQDNKSSMFVTVFLGIINVKTGELVYTNAGHNPPYIRRGDGSLQKVDAFHGPVIGAMPGLPYDQDRATLQPDDAILLYTDGVTEAFNEQEQLFSESRLEDFLENKDLDSAKSIVTGTIDEVNLFAGEAEQSDDITLLAVQYLGLPAEMKSKELQLTIKNRYEDMEIVEGQFSEFAEEFGLPDAVRQSMSIVMDEMLNNIISYAYQGEVEKEIEVNFELSGRRLVTTIKDSGVPFNPFSRETPDVSESIEEREIGGLGIHMVRSLMDEFSYHRQINKNVITLVKLIED